MTGWNITLSVQNTGNVALTNVTVRDPKVGLYQNLGELIAGGTAILTATYGPVAESDLPGPITNTATVTGMTPISTAVGPVTATHTVSATGYPNLTLSSVPNPSAFGQNVTFTATVVAAAPVGKTPTGVVTFTVEGTPVTATLSSGMATYSTPGLSAGEHPVWFAYGGDQSFLPNTSEPLTQTVNQAATATALESAPNPTVFGQTVTFTATVTVSARRGRDAGRRDDLHSRHDAAGYGASECKRRGDFGHEQPGGGQPHPHRAPTGAMPASRAAARRR